MANEQKISKWWFGVLPPAVVLSYLFVVTFLGWWDSEWFLRSGVGRVAVLPMKSLYVWLGWLRPHRWGPPGMPWSTMAVPALVLVLASLLVGWAGYRLRFASRRALLVVGVVMGIVVATGAAAHLGWRLWSRSIAPDALHEYRVMLRRVERECRRREWECLWSGRALRGARGWGTEVAGMRFEVARDVVSGYTRVQLLTLLEARSRLPGKLSPWEEDILSVSLQRLRTVGNREGVVKLLSLYFRPRTVVSNFDWFLVKHYGDWLEDPILLLCDAYERTGRPEVKESILSLLASAFPMVPREGDGDAFVQSCRQWYLKHKDRLVLNPDYDDD